MASQRDGQILGNFLDNEVRCSRTYGSCGPDHLEQCDPDLQGHLCAKALSDLQGHLFAKALSSPHAYASALFLAAHL